MSAYGDLAAPRTHGLAALVRRMETEHADEAAQASVEGRQFIPPLGGIDRQPSPFWRANGVLGGMSILTVARRAFK